jgi:hypothetical protein
LADSEAISYIVSKAEWWMMISSFILWQRVSLLENAGLVAFALTLNAKSLLE